MIPAFGQRCLYSVVPSAKDAWDVFQQQVDGSYCANQSHEFKKETTSLAINARSFAGTAKILAGESPDPEVGLWKLAAVSFVMSFALIISEPFRKDFAAVAIDLDLADTFMPGPFKAQIDATNTSKE